MKRPWYLWLVPIGIALSALAKASPAERDQLVSLWPVALVIIVMVVLVAVARAKQPPP